MDTIRVSIEPVEGAPGIQQARVWVNEVELAWQMSCVGADPTLLTEANKRAAADPGAVEVVVARCSQCLDEACGYAVAEISRGHGSVTWSLFTVWVDDDTHRDPWQALKFDAAQYDAAFAAAQLLG